MSCASGAIAARLGTALEQNVALPHGMTVADPRRMRTQGTAAVTTAIRDRFVADHRRLEKLLERLLAAFEVNDREDMARLWNGFDSGLLAHLEAEEAHLIPGLAGVRELEARELLDEHQRFRECLTELGVSLELHTIRLDSARAFMDELRAHAQKEDQLLYRWGDTHLGEQERESLFTALSARVAAGLSDVREALATKAARK
jgi:hemerythrin-like domain-containing protein